MLNYQAGVPPIDRVFHALADPTRRRMVERLSHGPVSVSVLAKPLKISLSAVMQHLDVLEASGVVQSEKVGRIRTCRVQPAALQTIERWVEARRSQWDQRFDRLGDFLAGQDAAGLETKTKPSSTARTKRGRKK
jgi:DNA-binding transcriptional ArsR family regulator